jgi:hypothetical protein
MAKGKTRIPNDSNAVKVQSFRQKRGKTRKGGKARSLAVVGGGVVIRDPAEDGHVCHGFPAVGDVTPANTRVAGQIFNPDGTPLLDSGGNPVVGNCVTTDGTWACSFTVPGGVPANTALVLQVDTVPSSGAARVDIIVDAC